MATTPTPTLAPKPAAPAHSPPPAPTGPEKADEPEKKGPPELDPEQAVALFRNGDRIAKAGDPPEKWITQGRLGDGTPVLETPLPDDYEETIKSGKYYLVKSGG